MSFRLVSFITIALTFILINLGGYVHNTESSLACPDWPLCYGQVFPKMEGGILIEHSHRLLASLVGFMTVILTILSFKNRKQNKKLFHFTLGALALVIFQGILGGLTVIYKLPTLVSTAHLGTSMIFFATLIYLNHLEKNDFSKKLEPSTWDSNVRPLLLLSLGLIYTQMLLGALMRHLGLGAACGLGLKNSVLCFDHATWGSYLIPASIQGQIHMAHRIYAVIVALVIIFTVMKLQKALLEQKIKNLFYWLPFPIVIGQIFLGILSVATHIGQISTMLHLGGAALLFAVTWKIYLLVFSLEKTSGLETKTSFFSDVLSLMKPRLSALVIATAAMGLFLAPGHISFFRGFIAVLATTGVVAGACIINCYLEREIDGKMKRTMDRPLPAGRIKPEFALNLGVGFIVFFVFILFFKVNPLTGILALIASLLYVFLYTPMKTKTTMALFAGAIPGAIPPLMGWTSVANSISPYALVLFGILFMWQLPHFLSISIYHAEDYNNAGIKILPKTLGVNTTIFHIVFYTLILGVISYVPYLLGENNSLYGVLIFLLGGAFFIYSLFGISFRDKKEKLMSWSRRYFYASLVYLPVVFVLMIFFK